MKNNALPNVPMTEEDVMFGMEAMTAYMAQLTDERAKELEGNEAAQDEDFRAFYRKYKKEHRK